MPLRAIECHGAQHERRNIISPQRERPGSVLTRTFYAGALLIFRVESGGDRNMREDALGPTRKPGAETANIAL